MLEEPASFSQLAGMARLLVVLDPIELELDVSGKRKSLCQYDSIAFVGDDPVKLVTLNRPGRVLNLMSRADRWKPSIDRSDAPSTPIGWVAWSDGVAARIGDLVLDPVAPQQATLVRFLEVG